VLRLPPASGCVADGDGTAVRSSRFPGRPEYCGFRLNPRLVWPVSPVAVTAVRKGLGSDEETGVRRTNAGLDWPRLHADGARLRQARGGRRTDARPLVPDANRGVPAPEVAAVVSAGPGGGLIAESSADARIHAQPGTLDKISKLSGAGNPRRRAPVPWATRKNQDHQSFAPATVAVRRAFLALLGSDMCHARAGVPEAANRAKRTIVTRYPGCAPAYCRQ
jgi:hypothetical protein